MKAAMIVPSPVHGEAYQVDKERGRPVPLYAGTGPGTGSYVGYWRTSIRRGRLMRGCVFNL